MTWANQGSPAGYEVERDSGPIEAVSTGKIASTPTGAGMTTSLLPHHLPNVATPPTRFRERVRARGGTAEVLAFRVGGERFGFDVRAVDEIMEAPPLEPVPGAAQSLAGVFSKQGSTIAVFLPSFMLGLAPTTGETLLLMRSGSRRVGLLVDDVDDVEVVDLSSVRDSPFVIEDDLLLGVVWAGEILTAILDARALVASCTVAPGGA